MSSGRREKQALKALVEFGTALRDRDRAGLRPAGLCRRRGAVQPAPPARARADGRAPESCGATDSSLQEETTQELATLARQLDGRPWREVVEKLRDEYAASPVSCWRSIGRKSNGPAGFVTERGLRHGAEERSGRGAYAGLSGRRWCPSRPTSRRRSICRSHRAGSMSPSPIPSCRPRLWPSSAGAIAATRIPVMVAHEAYPGHHLHLVTLQGLESEVRRHVWSPIMVEGWALYCEQLMEETGYYQTDRGAAVPAGQSAVASHPGGARCGPAHPRHDAGRSGGLYGGAPADRAVQRRSRSPAILRLAHIPAVLCGRPAGAAAACDSHTSEADRGGYLRRYFTMR